MLEFRLMLEGTTAYLAAIRADEQDLRKVAGLVESLTDARRRGDAASEVRMDARFHSALAEASHNALMRHCTTA
jgi:DNA-binding FadR family transcriptional regulator